MEALDYLNRHCSVPDCGRRLNYNYDRKGSVFCGNGHRFDVHVPLIPKLRIERAARTDRLLARIGELGACWVDRWMLEELGGLLRTSEAVLSRLRRREETTTVIDPLGMCPCFDLEGFCLITYNECSPCVRDDHPGATLEERKACPRYGRDILIPRRAVAVEDEPEHGARLKHETLPARFCGQCLDYDGIRCCGTDTAHKCRRTVQLPGSKACTNFRTDPAQPHTVLRRPVAAPTES